MTYAQRFHRWLTEVATIMNKKNEKELEENAIITAAVIEEMSEREKRKNKKRKYKKKRFWVHPIFKLRCAHGFYHAVFPTLSMHEPKFMNYMRMTSTQFEDLLCLIAPFITKKTVVREPIPAAERLSITLRYRFFSNFIVFFLEK